MPARHKDLADLVGASRPRVTEFLIQFEREHFIIRDERRLIVRRDRLEGFLAETHPRVTPTKKAHFPSKINNVDRNSEILPRDSSTVGVKRRSQTQLGEFRSNRIE